MRQVTERELLEVLRTEADRTVASLRKQRDNIDAALEKAEAAAAKARRMLGEVPGRGK